MNETAIRISAYAIGLIIKSFGLSLMICASLGTGPWEGFYVGMSNRFGLTVGSWLILFGIIIIFFNSYLIKSKPDFLSIITIFILGSCIDFWLNVFDFQLVEVRFQMLIFLIGLFVASIGISIYVQGQFAITPLDQLMYALCKRFGLSLMTSKLILDVCALTLALMLKGPIGLGTILYTFSSAPLIQFFIPKIEQILFTHKKQRI